jgi:hypothetical protein
MKAIIKGIAKKTVVAPKKGAQVKKPGAGKEVSKRASAPRENIVDKILRLTAELRIDGPSVWVGKGTKRQLWDQMVANASNLRAAKLKKTNEILFVQGTVVYAWALTGTDGATYERMHGKIPVRGSIALLKKEYGANNVKLLTKERLMVLAKQLKIDAGCKAALGL